MYHLFLLIFTITRLFCVSHGIPREACSDFIKSSGHLRKVQYEPQFNKYIYLDFIKPSGKYNLSTQMYFDSIFAESEGELLPMCIGLLGAEVVTTIGESHLVTFKVKTNEQIPVGVVVINNTCWYETGNFLGCRIAFLMQPELLDYGMLSFSPLIEGFWTSLQNEMFRHDDWLLTLTIENHHTSIPPSWVSHMNISSLKELYISGNVWGRPEKLLGKLPNLNTLFLMNNSIEALPDDTFLNLPEVKSVLLQLNKFTRLPKHLSNATALLLNDQSGNEPLIITDEEILTLENIQTIQMNTHLRADVSIFFKLPYLRTLTCRGCLLRNVSRENVILGNDSLIGNLNLASNNLTSLPMGIFQFLTKLNSLDLGSNQFEECPCGALNALRNLRKLSFSKNRITNIPAGCFSQLNKVSNLDLSSNAIIYLDPLAFSNKSILTYLYLQHNLLSIVDSNALSPLKKLVRLDISYNKLKEAPVFGENALGFLGLSHNLLTKITNLTTSIRFIQSLDLSGNHILELKFQNVFRLNLSYNSLTYINEDMRTYLKNLNMLDLGGNHFECCHENISIIRNWVNASKEIIRNLNTDEPLTCIPRSGEAQVLLEDLTDESLCYEHTRNLLLEIVLPLVVLLTCVLAFFVARHYYQFQFVYVGYFFRMKKRTFLLQDDIKLTECVYDAFVCYSGKNLLWITEQLIPVLEEGPEQYRFCLHDRDFTVGAPIDMNIIESLNKSRKVIFILTKDFLSSTWCQWELDLANHRMLNKNKNYIILIEIEEVNHANLPSHIKCLISYRTYLKWPCDPKNVSQNQRYWQRLKFILGDSIFKQTGKLPQGGTVLDL